MSVISLFFKKRVPTQLIRTLGGANPSPIILDATIKETFSIKAEPTQHPVEGKADITDHVIIKPNTLAINGIITETPFEGLAGIVKTGGATVGSAIGSALGPFGTAVGALAGAAGGSSLASAVFGGGDRVLSAVADEFIALRDAKQPIDIQTGLKLYKSYIMSSAVISRDQKTGGSIMVDLEFTEIIFASAQITSVAIPRVKGALNKSKLGRQSKEGLSTDQNGQGASLLKKIAPKFLGGV